MSTSETQLRQWGDKIRDPKATVMQRASAMWSLRHAPEPLATRLLLDFVTGVLPPADPASNALLQHEAAYCLGQRGDASAVDGLENVLRDERHEAIVRHEAAEALAALASAPGVDLQRVKRILSDFESIGISAIAETCQVGVGRVQWQGTHPKHTAEEQAATEAFSNTVDPAPPFATEHDISELCRLIMDSTASLFERYQALYSLRNAGLSILKGSASEANKKSILEGLSAALTAPGSALLRHQTAFLLGQLKLVQTGDALLRALKDTQEAPMVRHESAFALGKMVADADLAKLDAEFAQKAKALLTEMSKDPEPVVRDSCVLALEMPEYVTASGKF